jgi:beta-lactamase class A
MGAVVSQEFSLTRRDLIVASSCAVLCAYAGALGAKEPGVTERLEAIRSRIGGRLGVYAIDTDRGKRVGLDEGSRYAMASTFKLMLAAAVLSSVDKGSLTLEQRVAISAQDMLAHAPITSKHVAAGSITIRELCAAAVQESDNPAANLLLTQIGGPDGLTRFMRSIGDDVTRLDRTELALNTNLPGDLRDTTTPRAMVDSMERVLTKHTLSDASRDLLIDWMVRSPRGLNRIRAGLPQDWKVGDKTGAGQNGAINDLAIAWPPRRGPILMAVYMSESKLPTEQLAAAHAEIGAALAHYFV